MKRHLRPVFLSLGVLLLTAAAVVHGIDQGAVVVGFPESIGVVEGNGFKEFKYGIQNLTPYEMRVVSRPEGCSEKATLLESIGPYGRLEKTGTIYGSDHFSGSGQVKYEIVGFCGESPFVIDKTVRFEVR